MIRMPFIISLDAPIHNEEGVEQTPLLDRIKVIDGRSDLYKSDLERFIYETKYAIKKELEQYQRGRRGPKSKNLIRNYLHLFESLCENQSPASVAQKLELSRSTVMEMRLRLLQLKAVKRLQQLLHEHRRA